MSRKRRMFDIDMPEDTTAVEEPQFRSVERRSPMASAIAENADALKERRSQADAIRAENDALAHELVALREAGHVVQAVPLEDVHTYMLARERIPGEDHELENLVTSIRDIGLSNPIRVLPRPGEDGFELVQGFRRLSAYKALHAADGQGGWDKIPALVMPGSPDIAGLYRRMVDENVIRRDLSFAEMARAAQNFAADPGTPANDIRRAVAALFESAPYSKRNYIRSFALLLDQIGGELAYPNEIPRALGVSLARILRDQPEVAKRIAADLKGWDNRSVSDELGVLRRYAGEDEGEAPAPVKKPARAGQGGRTKTTFHITSTAGQVKCTAGQGRLEIKVDRDFSAIERARLEQAIASLIDGLG